MCVCIYMYVYMYVYMYAVYMCVYLVFINEYAHINMYA